MPKTSYTPEQREHALAVYREHGAGAASRETGIPRPTITSWARRSGLQADAATDREQTMRKAVDMARLTFAQKRLHLAERSMEGAVVLLERALAAEADAIDSQRWSTAVSTLANTAQLLSGAATIRTEALGDPEARLDRVARMRDELKERRELAEAQAAETG